MFVMVFKVPVVCCYLLPNWTHILLGSCLNFRLTEIYMIIHDIQQQPVLGTKCWFCFHTFSLIIHFWSIYFFVLCASLSWVGLCWFAISFLLCKLIAATALITLKRKSIYIYVDMSHLSIMPKTSMTKLSLYGDPTVVKVLTISDKII